MGGSEMEAVAGYSDGYGDGDGDGGGDGDGAGDGDGDGDGYGDGYGHGSGKGSGYGNGDGYGSGFGYGEGDGYDGEGYGSGDGDGDGDGEGDGDGDGNADGPVWVDPATPLMAWHYVDKQGLTREHGGVVYKAEPGLVMRWVGDVRLCQTGLHASLTLDDALHCATEIHLADGILTRVACSGDVIMGDDKLVCSRREVIEVYEAGELPKGAR